MYTPLSTELVTCISVYPSVRLQPGFNPGFPISFACCTSFRILCCIICVPLFVAVIFAHYTNDRDVAEDVRNGRIILEIGACNMTNKAEMVQVHSLLSSSVDLRSSASSSFIENRCSN